MEFWEYEQKYYDKKYEQSYSIKSLSAPLPKIYAQLSNTWDRCVEHILKLYYYKDTPIFDFYENNWKVSVAKCISKVDKLKSTNKLPSYDFIMETIWYDVKDDYLDSQIEYVVDNITSDYEEIPPMDLSTIDIDDFKSKVYEYMEFVAEKLSTKGKYNVEEGKFKIEEILGI